MLHLFKKKPQLEPVNVSDETITALADGTMISIEAVSDSVFSQKMMGDGVAFNFDQDEVTICSPANGTLSLLFPTAHAFGVTMNNGVELLVHIGINTVEEKGKGFKAGTLKQGDTIKAGNPIVTVDMAALKNKYNMSTMLIVTNPNEKNIEFINPQKVTRGQRINN